MNQEEALQILNQVGAVITGSHLVYTSGLHGSVYVNKDALTDDTAVSLICEALAWQFRDDGVEVVVAPAVGGIKFAAKVAHRLNKLTRRTVLGLYAERDETSILRAEEDVSLNFGATGKAMVAHLEKGDELVVRRPNFVLKRGYGKLVAGKKVLVAEDVLTTGGSARKVVEAVRAAGGNVIGVGVICNRGGVKPADLADPPKLFALVNLTLETYYEADCPLCRDGVAMNTEVGKGKDWLARNAHKFQNCPECHRALAHYDNHLSKWVCPNCGPDISPI